MILKKTEVSAEEILLVLEGSLMGQEATEAFQSVLEECATSTYHQITVNMKKVNAINSSNIGKLFLYQKRLSQTGKTIRIRGVSDELSRTFILIKADQILDIQN